jgi:hypothetical protein
MPTVASLWRRYRWVAAAAAVVVLAVGLAIVTPPTAQLPTTRQQPAAVWVTDAHLQEELAEITAGIEMLEARSNGKAPDVAPAPDADEQLYDELEFFFDQLRAEVDA